MSSARCHLRPWLEADRGFLYELHRDTMLQVVAATWGWNERWQQQDFAKRLSTQTVEVVEQRGERVGSLWWDWLHDGLYLHQLSVLPSHQSRGIGTIVVQYLLNRASVHGMPVMLSVLEANPRAKSLYEKLGFSVEKIESPFVRMTCHP